MSTKQAYNLRELLSDAVASAGAGYRGYRSQEHDAAQRSERRQGDKVMEAAGKGDLNEEYRQRKLTEAAGKLTRAAKGRLDGATLAAGATSWAPVADEHLLAALAGGAGQLGASQLLGRLKPGASPVAGALTSAGGSLLGRMALRALLSPPSDK